MCIILCKSHYFEHSSETYLFVQVEVKPALSKEQQAAKKAQEMGGYRGVGRGMVGASFGYGVPTASYAQYQPPVLYQASDPTGAASAYSIGYPAGYSQPGAVAPYAGVPSYEVQPTQSFATVRYPGMVSF